MKIITILILSLFLFQQYTFTQPLADRPSQLFSKGLIFVPASLTEVTSKTITVDLMTFSNVSGSAVVLTSVQDETTNCNSGVCQFFASVSIAANTTYVVSIPGGVVFAGLKWQAGTANALVGYIRGATGPV